MQPETTTDNRKTFRLDAAAAASLATLKQNHGTENAAINHALVALPRQIEQQNQQLTKLREELREANKETNNWREHHDRKRNELDQLKNALALIGKFLNPAE
jgi:septal ring factor EnvC (AmiA/AmiB activator)